MNREKKKALYQRIRKYEEAIKTACYECSETSRFDCNNNECYLWDAMSEISSKYK